VRAHRARPTWWVRPRRFPALAVTPRLHARWRGQRGGVGRFHQGALSEQGEMVRRRPTDSALREGARGTPYPRAADGAADGEGTTKGSERGGDWGQPSFESSGGKRGRARRPSAARGPGAPSSKAAEVVGARQARGGPAPSGRSARTKALAGEKRDPSDCVGGARGFIPGAPPYAVSTNEDARQGSLRARRFGAATLRQ
jgi:hypothetical protein